MGQNITSLAWNFNTVTFGGGASNAAVNVTGQAFTNSAILLATVNTAGNAFATYTISATYAGGNPAVWTVNLNFSTNGIPGAGTVVGFAWLELAN